MKIKYTPLLVFFGGMAASQAATITWTTQANAAPDLLATTLDAINMGAGPAGGIWTDAGTSATDTANTNILSTLNAGGPGLGGNGTVPTSGDANLDIALNDHRWSDNDSETFTLSGLNTGDTYRIQFYFTDTRTGGIDNRQFHFDDGAGNSSAITTRGATDSIIGTFVADGATQTVNYISDTPGGGVGLNAYTLSTTPVPEPASTALLGLGGLALILRRRK